jgi:signal transduction histidine kinase
MSSTDFSQANFGSDAAFNCTRSSSAVKRRVFYGLISSFAVCALIYYFEELVDLTGWTGLHWPIFYTVHDLQRMLFLGPIVYAAYWFRLRGVVIVTLASFVTFLPRTLFISPYPNPMLRVIVFVLIAAMVGILVERLTKMVETIGIYKGHLEKLVDERTMQLEKANEALQGREHEIQVLYKGEHEIREELERQIKARVEFTRALVHELKTPLTPMVAASEAIMAGMQEEPWKSLAVRVNRGAISLSDRIDELLDIAKGEIGILKLSCQSMEPKELLHELYELCSAEASKRGQSLFLNIPDHLLPVWADRERLRQVVLNLLDNAFKYTPKGGEVILEARVEDSSLVIDVQDTGIGMTTQQLEMVFKPYERIESNGEHLSGLGLGLSLAKTLVELHGGRIWIKSEKGKGSTVSFAIPGKESKEDHLATGRAL